MTRPAGELPADRDRRFGDQHRGHAHGWERLSRRRFLGAAALASGAALGGDLWLAGVAHAAPAGTGTPRPIPTGIQPFGPSGPLFHVHAPPESETRANDDFSTITDFDGVVGLAHVTGTGIGVTGGVSKSLTYAVDNRFMVGEFVGTDGRLHRGTFGFV
jgi:hypothetical protein